MQRVILPVSVIVPVLNRPEMVLEALTSIFNGSVLPSEVIVVCCPLIENESSIELKKNLNHLDKNELEYPDFATVKKFFAINPIKEVVCKVLQLPQLLLIEASKNKCNVSLARNFGVQEAKKYWIAFLDSDDLWTEHKLQKQWDYLRQRPHLKTACTSEIWLKNQKNVKQPLHLQARRGSFLHDSFSYCLISCSSLLIQKTFFNELGGFDQSFSVCEDFDFYLRVLIKEPIGLLNEKVVIKRSGIWPQLSRRPLLDEERVRSLLKFYEIQKENLSEVTTSQLKIAILKKIKILIRGGEKYSNDSLVKKYQNLLFEHPLLQDKSLAFL